MTKKKKKALEEARLAEELRKKEAQKSARRPAAQNGGMYGGIVLPGMNGQIRGIQLPPIVQPITFDPSLMAGVAPTKKEADNDFDDDFDDDDDF